MFEPNYINIVDAAGNKEAARLPLYEQIHYCCMEHKGSEYELLVNGNSWASLRFVYTRGLWVEQMRKLSTEIFSVVPVDSLDHCAEKTGNNSVPQ